MRCVYNYKVYVVAVVVVQQVYKEQHTQSNGKEKKIKSTSDIKSKEKITNIFTAPKRD